MLTTRVIGCAIAMAMTYAATGRALQRRIVA